MKEFKAVKKSYQLYFWVLCPMKELSIEWYQSQSSSGNRKGCYNVFKKSTASCIPRACYDQESKHY